MRGGEKKEGGGVGETGEEEEKKAIFEVSQHARVTSRALRPRFPRAIVNMKEFRIDDRVGKGTGAAREGTQLGKSA